MLTGDMTEVNFSSARVRLIDFRRNVEQMQWLVLKPRLLDRIHQAFVDAGVLAGVIRSRDYAVDYSTPKWDYVNPMQEVQADQLEISTGLSSISEKLRRRGYTPLDVFKEIKADFDLLKEMGVLDTLLLLQKGRVSEVVPDADGEPAPATKPAAAPAKAKK
jgi:capsid protein